MFDKIENDKGNHDLIRKFIRQAYRVLKNNSAIYIFCSWHNVDFFKREVEKYFTLKNIIVWNKNNHGAGDLKGAYAPKHELILFAHKGRALLQEYRYPDVLDFNKVAGSKLKHPTEKPVDLLELFIRNSSKEEDIVLDPFSGSSPIAEACINTGRKYICIELDYNYYQISLERIGNH